jgi:hypothetical protein
MSRKMMVGMKLLRRRMWCDSVGLGILAFSTQTGKGIMTLLYYNDNCILVILHLFVVSDLDRHSLKKSESVSVLHHSPPPSFLQ